MSLKEHVCHLLACYWKEHLQSIPREIERELACATPDRGYIEELREQAEQGVSEIERNLSDNWAFFAEGTGSPIEAAFYLAFKVVASKLLLTGVDETKQASFLGGRYDFLFQRQNIKIVVECDGYYYHSSKERMSVDRRRDRTLQANGYMVFRFTGSDLYQRPVECAAEVCDRLQGLP